MKKTALLLAAVMAFGMKSVQAAEFDVNFIISGDGYSSSSMTASTLKSIEFTGSYSFNPNTACTEPFTIVRDGVTVLSTLASEGKIVTEDDGWDETTAISFTLSPFNQAGVYTITSPAGFFKRSNGDTSNVKEVELTLTSPVPSSVTLVVDGENVALTAGEDNVYTAKGVEITGAGSVKIQGTTYYGAVNGQTTDLTIGEATPIGYNGKNWTVAPGTYDVTVDWNELNPTITFAQPAPAVETFALEISVQEADNENNTATDFEKIDFPAQFDVYVLNSANDEPITVAWNNEVVYTIERTAPSSVLIPVEDDGGWDSEIIAYMINLGERVNRVGKYTITVPQGFFKSGSKLNAAVSKTITINSPMPSTLTIQGKSGSLEEDVEMTLSGSVFTASNVVVKGVDDGFGEIRLFGNTWYGYCNKQDVEVPPYLRIPVGYHGGYWKVPAGTYVVTVNWTDDNPNIIFTEDKTVGVSFIAEDESTPVLYNLQGVRVNNPEKGETLIEVRNGKATKRIY